MNNIFKIEFGKICFYTGIFFLASAPVISAILLLYSVIISCINDKRNFLKDRFNLLFLVSGFFFILSSTRHLFFSENDFQWSPTLSFIGLLNYIPYFFCFWGFQNYLNSKLERKQLCFFLIFSSIPILFSGFTQAFLGWTGPYEIFNGLIIWYQRDMPTLTGLFNNPNYTSSWLVTILPFCLIIFLRGKNKFFKSIGFLISFFTIGTIFLTGSRSGWIGAIIAFSSFLNLHLYFVFYFVVLIILFIVIDFLFLRYGIVSFALSIIPDFIKKEFPVVSISNLDQFTRIAIWKNTFLLIKDRPLWGYGGGIFKELYATNISNIGYSHAHNLFFEIAISYGIFPSIILLGVFVYLIYKSIRILRIHRSNEKNLNFDKAIVISSIIILFTQLLDVQYYDFRISCLFWLLMSSLKCIQEDNQLIMNQKEI